VVLREDVVRAFRCAEEWLRHEKGLHGSLAGEEDIAKAAWHVRPPAPCAARWRLGRGRGCRRY
jgi:hypothetical protein